jgi:uncharacterized protein YbaP (TraB family)
VRLAFAVLFLIGCQKDDRPPQGQAPKGDDPRLAPAVVVEKTLTSPFLWSAKKDGNTTYFLGTMHLGVDARRLPPVVWQKLDEAKSFAMESNGGDPALMRLGRRRSGSLSDDLGPAYWDKLGAVLGKQRASEADPFKPVIAAIWMGTRELPETASMDHEVYEYARSNGKRVTYLEEAGKQVDMLERLLDVRMLKYMIDDADTGAKGQRALLAAYLDGDPDALLAAGTSERAAALAHGFSAAEYDAMSEELIYARNRAWIAGIEEIHADGIAFAAVGALHLVGPNSVLDLLQKRGFVVARVLN